MSWEVLGVEGVFGLIAVGAVLCSRFVFCLARGGCTYEVFYEVVGVNCYYIR